MKLTPIEKQMLIGVGVCIILLAICLTTLSRSLNKMKENGGLKAAVNELWNGKTNSASTNR